MWWVRACFKVFMRPLLFIIGLTWIRRKYLHINDVIAYYRPPRNIKNAPIVVSNHTSYLDMFYFMSTNVSFLAKAEVAKTFFIGMFAIARQSIFIERESEENREKVVELIKERAERIHRHEDIPPLMIFPEGTVTNGRSLMSFKKGAFITGDPIKIFTLKYNPHWTQIISSIANISPLFTVILSMSQPLNTLEITEYVDFLDPVWVYQKHNVRQEDEKAWEYVAEEVKKLMAFASGFETTEESFRDTIEQEKLLSMYNDTFFPRKTRPDHIVEMSPQIKKEK